MRKSLFWTIMIAVALGVLAVIFFSPRSPLNKHHNNGAAMPVASAANYNVESGLVLPLVQLEGDWSWKQNDMAFTGKVEGDTIKINLVSSDGYAMTYWRGSFKAAESVGAKIVSKAAGGEMQLSVDDTKEFTIGKDSISFVFRFDAIGVTKTVTLTR